MSRINPQFETNCPRLPTIARALLCLILALLVSLFSAGPVLAIAETVTSESEEVPVEDRSGTEEAADFSQARNEVRRVRQHCMPSFSDSQFKQTCPPGRVVFASRGHRLPNGLGAPLRL